MEKYELLTSYSDQPESAVKLERTYIDLNFGELIEATEERDSYKRNTVRVREGEPTEDGLIRFLIHTEYEVDDEIALINNKAEKPEEYEAYIAKRNELKAIAKTLYANYLSAK